MKRFKINLRLTGAKTVSFYRREDGATAIEFAILALPFFAMLFGILELAVVFFVQSNVQNATFEASRQVRTGEFNSTDEDEFKNIICTQMKPNSTAVELTECRAKLDVKISLMGDFSKATSFAPTPPPVDPNNPPPSIEASGGGDTVLVKVIYQQSLALPGKFTRLSNKADGNGFNDGTVRHIKIVTAFRNEPF